MANMMTPEIIVGLFSLIGTLCGTMGGILTSSKLTSYRISELEKKVDKHNSVIERVALLEQADKLQWEIINDSKEYIEKLKEEVRHNE